MLCLLTNNKGVVGIELLPICDEFESSISHTGCVHALLGSLLVWLNTSLPVAVYDLAIVQRNKQVYFAQRQVAIVQ